MARWSLAAALVSLSRHLIFSPPPAATTALDDDSGRQHPCVYYDLAVTCYPTDARAGVTSFETVGVKKTRVPEELRKQC